MIGKLTLVFNMRCLVFLWAVPQHALPLIQEACVEAPWLVISGSFLSSQVRRVVREPLKRALSLELTLYDSGRSPSHSWCLTHVHFLSWLYAALHLPWFQAAGFLSVDNAVLPHATNCCLTCHYRNDRWQRRQTEQMSDFRIQNQSWQAIFRELKCV